MIGSKALPLKSSRLICEKRDRQALGEHRMKREEQETQHVTATPVPRAGHERFF